MAELDRGDMTGMEERAGALIRFWYRLKSPSVVVKQYKPTKLSRAPIFVTPSLISLIFPSVVASRCITISTKALACGPVSRNSDGVFAFSGIADEVSDEGSDSAGKDFTDLALFFFEFN